MKSYNFNVRTDITRSMNAYNKTQSEVRFNTLDAVLLNLIRSFSESNTEFYMSNKELAQTLIADPSTIQRSVDRLVQTELITKKIAYVNNRPKRVLVYEKDKVQEVLNVGELFGELHGELYNASV